MTRREGLERTLTKARDVLLAERQANASAILEERRQRELLEEQSRMTTMELTYLRGEEKRLKEEVALPLVPLVSKVISGDDLLWAGRVDAQIHSPSSDSS